MQSNRLYLFRDTRFLPIFIVQCCGCLNDSLLKNALIILITYKLSSQLVESTQLLVLAANTVFVLPFVIFASIAGQVADRYERSTIVKIIKLFELSIVLFATYGFFDNSLVILFLSIFLMGIHSTFFGPIKYSVLPDHLYRNELLGANGFVEAGTFISILVGTIIGGYYTISGNLIITILIIIAIVGVIASYFMPKSNNSNCEIKINLNLFRESIEMIKYAQAKKQVYLAILGISWFWFISAAILAQIPSLAKNTFGADENVANLFLATFSIGVGVGSFWCSKIFGNEITTKYVFVSAIGISIFGIDLFFASRISAVHYEPEQLKSIFVFLSKKHNWRIIIDLFFISAIAGLYIVPLFAVLQYFSSSAHRSRIIAINNFINALFMAGSTVILSLLFYWEYSIPSVILFISLLNIVVAYYIYQLIPEVKIVPFAVNRAILKFLFDCMYRVEVKGIENFYKAGKRSVIIANHISYIDPALLATYLPEEMTFAINTTIAKALWVRPFLKMAKTLPVDPTNAMAIKTLIREVQKDKKIAIFPEGRISITGSLMKIYEGPGMIAEKSDATILPVRIDGTQFTHFSKLKNILKTRIFPKITITILPPVKFPSKPNIDNREKRKYIGQALYDIMADMMFESSDYQNTIFQSLIETAKAYGFNKKIIQDIDDKSVTYRQLILGSFTLANLIKQDTEVADYVGLMLPNMVETMVTFYAMQACCRRPVMIDYMSEVSNIVASCKTTSVKMVYTSKQFVEKAGLQEVVAKILADNIKIIYLEDLTQRIGLYLKIKAIIASFFPQSYYNNICSSYDDNDPSVVVFTSGISATAKAVVLSHRNLQANRCQLLAKVHFSPDDFAFMALPLFHCFGLSGTIMMTLNAIPVFLYSSSLHYRSIPEVIYDIGATIMFGTDIFLYGYAVYAHPYDFYSIRYVFASSEKLRKDTRELWLDKFGIRIFEGYGTSETSPIISCNTPMHYRAGSVGRLMPKIEYYIRPIHNRPLAEFASAEEFKETTELRTVAYSNVFEEQSTDSTNKLPAEVEFQKRSNRSIGIEGIGQLFIKGPNIMLGYMHSNNPGIIHPTSSEELGLGWYDTGDIVKIDEDGYLTLLGHIQQFVTIEEVMSLILIEDLANMIDVDSKHVAICPDDDNKDKQIFLLTTSQTINSEKFIEIMHKNSIDSNQKNIPVIIPVKEIPILPIGKVNYRQITKMLENYRKVTKMLK
ncbi:acyl-[ACP]--phospholipid O-acyltransferase [Candidatus Tisiphia endosymbiont of Psammoecus bipunctatus]|uniref:acyl-[ACP]--phospholipid O-acyltransferase n=1 Tax=Candidatus Tisiphia endosymbiont of Psammoecus bipunctatus TaxID=3139333 RepID=UPI00397764E3